MPKTKAPTTNRKLETIAALKQFKEGDRVYNNLTKQHGYFHSANYKNAMPDCWVKYEVLRDDELFIYEVGVPANPLNLELCHCKKYVPYRISTSLPELADSLTPHNKSEELEPLNLLKSTAMLKESCEATGEVSQSTPISEIISPDATLTLLQLDSPAPTHPQPEIEPESMENLAPSGLKPCESLTNANHDLSLLKTPQDYSIEEWDASFKAYPKAGTMRSGRLSPQQPLERPKPVKGYLLSPTLTSGDSTPKSRAAGQTKCEIWFRSMLLLTDSQCLSPQMMALLLGFPSDWTKCLWESIEEPLDELKADTSTEDASAPPKPPLSGNGSNILTVLQELTIDEERDRHRLERKVESAFIKAESVFRDAVFALKEIRDRKLYRSSHATFDEYCKERFNFKRARPYQLINAAIVLENLGECLQPVDILPDKESQCREIAKLKDPLEQREAWVEITKDGEIAPIKEIKSIVRRTLEKTFVPYTERSEYQGSDVVVIKSKGNSSLRPYDGYWGIINRISSFAYHVLISVKNEVVLCKVNEMKRVELGEKDRAEIKAVSDRIHALAMLLELDAFDRAGLEVMQRSTFWTERQKQALTQLEQLYGI